MNLLIRLLFESRTTIPQREEGERILKQKMDETSSGYSSRGESHPDEYLKSTKADALSALNGNYDVLSSTLGNDRCNDALDNIFSKSSTNSISLSRRRSDNIRDQTREGTAVEKISKDSTGLNSCQEVATQTEPETRSREQQFATTSINVRKESNVFVQRNDGTLSSRFQCRKTEKDLDPGAVIEELRYDNMALQRQLISSQQFFYHLIDDLKARLVEAESYAKMVMEQLKECKRATRSCSCGSVSNTSSAITKGDGNLPHPPKTTVEADMFAITNLKREVSTPSIGSSNPRIRKVHSADNISRLKDDASSFSSSSGGLSSVEIKQNLRERNKQLQQQIAILRETQSASSTMSLDREKDNTVTPHLVSSSYFKNATHPKGSRFSASKQRKDHIAVEEVRWIKKPPSSIKKKPSSAKPVRSQLSGFRTINVQSWSADGCNR